MDPPPPSPLPDEVVEEILVRIPPSDPATLARAAVASKRWCRFVTSPGFRRRYRALHRAAPMLGFIRDSSDGAGFVPTSTFRPKPRADLRGLRPLDARHGRVLFLRADGDQHSGGGGGGGSGSGGGAIDFLVWDPITDEMVGLPRMLLRHSPLSWKAAVLCAVPAEDCDHLDCHRGPFLVVLVITDDSSIRTYVYSSEAAVWLAEASPVSEFRFTPHCLIDGFVVTGHCTDSVCPAHSQRRTPLVGNALYFMCAGRILKCDWFGKRYSLQEEEQPALHSNMFLETPVPEELIAMGDGRLAFAAVLDSTLYIVKRDGDREMDTIALENLPPLPATPHVVGFAEGNGLIFLRIGNEIFSVDINSTQATMPARLKKVCEGSGIVPYINFCTPVMGVLSTDDGPKAVASSDGQSCVSGNLPRQGK